MRRVVVWSCPITLSLAVAFAVPSQAALIIQPTFASSITSLSNASQVENAITTAIGAIDSLYSNAGTVPVLFEYDSSLNGGASTDSALFNLSYSDYVGALQTDASAHPANTTLATALANLPASGTLAADFGATPAINVTAPFANLILQTQKFLCFDGSGNFHGGCDQTYEAVVTVSQPSSVGNFYTASGPGLNSTAVSAIEHELDEVLGGGGAGTTLSSSSTGNPASLGTMDLYRYGSTGTGCTKATGLSHTLVWSANTASIACYSIDGGNTAFAQFNQAGGSSDYGDFSQPNPAIQDAFEPASDAAVYSMLSPEFEMMQSIGYDSVPEPSTLGLFAAAVLGLRWLRRRQVRT